MRTPKAVPRHGVAALLNRTDMSYNCFLPKHLANSSSLPNHIKIQFLPDGMTCAPQLQRSVN